MGKKRDSGDSGDTGMGGKTCDVGAGKYGYKKQKQQKQKTVEQPQAKVRGAQVGERKKEKEREREREQQCGISAVRRWAFLYSKVYSLFQIHILPKQFFCLSLRQKEKPALVTAGGATRQ